MIGISAIACEIPQRRVSNLDRMARLQAGEDLVREKIGVLQVARLEHGDMTSDLCVKATKKLFHAGIVDPAKIGCLAVVTQNPDGRGLPHTAAIVHGKLDLPEGCATFDISLGCSGFVQGLSIVSNFMAVNEMNHGLLVTCDPYSKVVDDVDRNTTMLFGDAATATYLSSTPVWQIGRFDFGTRGKLHAALHVDDGGKLVMNGRDVFSFSADAVPQSIARVLALNGIALADVDRVLLHQGSKFIVDTIAKRIGAVEKAAFCASEYGNTVSSSIPILLAETLRPADRRVLLCGFGVGLTWASTVLERRIL